MLLFLKSGIVTSAFIILEVFIVQHSELTFITLCQMSQYVHVEG